MPQVPQLKPGEVEVEIFQEHKPWLDTFADTWAGKVGPKGQVEGSGMDYIRTHVLDNYLQRAYPNASEDDLKGMRLRGPKKIWWYFRSVAGTARSSKARSAKQIDIVHFWAQHEDNVETVKKLFQDYKSEHSLAAEAKIPAFNSLPEGEQLRFRELVTELRSENKKAKVLSGEARVKASENFVSDFLRYIRQAEDTMGVVVVANVAYEVDTAGALKVTSVSTGNGKKYKKSEQGVDSQVNFGQWLRERENKVVQQKIPLPIAYADRDHENLPFIPQFEGAPLLTVGRDILRVSVGAYWQRAFGGGPVPWKAVHASWVKGEHKFIDPARMPPECPLLDPSQMNLEQVLVWLEWLSRRQLGIGDKSTWFCFKVVFTSSLKPLPEGSEAIRHAETKRNNAKCWELEYNGWIEKCQVNGNINYPVELEQYEAYLLAQSAARQSLDHPSWHGLPSRSTSSDRPAIDSATQDLITELLEDVEDGDKDVLLGLVQVTNKMYSLLPAEDEERFWSDKKGSVLRSLRMPAILPSTFVKDFSELEYLQDFWATVDYHRPSFEVPENATHAFLETWQHRLIKGDALRHLESGALIGGRYGVRLGVLAIMKFILNIGAIKGKLKPPVPQPTGFDSRRVSDSFWHVGIEWCQTWTSEIKKSIEILQQTYEERTKEATLQPTSTVNTRTFIDDDESDTSIHGKTDKEPSPGPSRRLRPKPVPPPRLSPVDSDEEGSRASSDDEGDRSDTFKPPGDEESEEDDLDPPEAQGGVPNKGKQVDRGQLDPEEIRRKFMSSRVKAGSKEDREAYEKNQLEVTAIDDLVLENSELGSLSTASLNPHPFGELASLEELDDWAGSVTELLDECKSIVRETKSALDALHDRAEEPYHPNDDSDALKQATAFTCNGLPLYQVIFKQQIVWNRAKSLWPTMRWQLRVFQDLMRRAFYFLPILHVCSERAPAPVAPSLRALVKKLTRAAFESRFAYEEQYHLGLLSKHYDRILGPDWTDPAYVWTLSELQSSVEVVCQWGDDTTMLLEWHADCRRLTWAARSEDESKNPVPRSTWYRFGDPSPQEESEDIQAWLKAETFGTNSDDDETRVQDQDIDERSPEAEDRAALELLKADKPERNEGGQRDEPSGDEDDQDRAEAEPQTVKPVKKTPRRRISGANKPRKSGSSAQLDKMPEKRKQPNGPAQANGASASRKKQKTAEDNVKTAKGSNAHGTGVSRGETRAGRQLKPTARSLGS